MEGDLIIEGDVKIVFDLFEEYAGSNPFEYLVSVDGNLIIRDTDLTTLSYFDGFKDVGELEVEGNPDLECGTTYFPLLGSESLLFMRCGGVEVSGPGVFLDPLFLK